MLAWVAIGVGGAGIATGAVTGAMTLSKEGDLEENENCRDAKCLPSERDDVSGYNTLRTVSTVAWIGGAALAATGVVLLVTAPKPTETHAALVAGPGSLFLRGRF